MTPGIDLGDLSYSGPGYHVAAYGHKNGCKKQPLKKEIHEAK